MNKETRMERVDTMDREGPWLEYWRWWRSDRPEARLELKLKLQPRQQRSFLPGLKTLLRKRFTRLLDTLEHDPKISH